jgi:hypothetical protein
MNGVATEVASSQEIHILTQHESHREILTHAYGTTELEWQLTHSSTERGVILLFHGCKRGSHDWFFLPEERLAVAQLLENGYSVIAFSSINRQFNRKNGCWSNIWPLDAKDQHSDNPDILSVVGALSVWLARENKFHLPLFALGASSGGTFVTVLARTIYLSGAIIMISPGHPSALELPPTWDNKRQMDRINSMNKPFLDPRSLQSSESLFNLPPVLFVYMEGDKKWASARAIDNARKIILQLNPHLEGQVAVESIPPRALDEYMLMSIPAIAAKHFLCSRLFFMLSDWIGSDDAEHTSMSLLLDPITHLQLTSPRQSGIYSIVCDLFENVLAGKPSPSFHNSAAGELIHDSSREELIECSQIFRLHEEEISEILSERYSGHEFTSRKIKEQLVWMNQIIQDSKEA